MVSVIQEIKERLKDIRYRRAFGGENIRRDFAHAILNARKGEGLTQLQLAELANVSQAYISKLESGEANPTIGHIGSIAAAMWLRPRVTFDSLLLEDGIANAPRNIRVGSSHPAGDPMFVTPFEFRRQLTSMENMTTVDTGRGTANAGELCHLGLSR